MVGAAKAQILNIWGDLSKKNSNNDWYLFTRKANEIKGKKWVWVWPYQST